MKASDNAEITINGIPAVYDEKEHVFSAEIALYNYRNTLCAIDSKNGIMCFLIHEEYYYPDYKLYIPDCGERILKAIKHVYDKGYRSKPIEEIIFE